MPEPKASKEIDSKAGAFEPKAVPKAGCDVMGDRKLAPLLALLGLERALQGAEGAAKPGPAKEG